MFPMLAAAAAFTAPVPAMTNDWFSPVYDWPKTGIGRNELVVVEAEITVNRNGYMERCTGHVRSGNPQMGPYVCSRLKLRNVFEPARDPDGKRMFGVYRNFVVLFNGGRDSKEFPPYRATDFDIAAAAGKDAARRFFIQFAVDPQGRPSACSLVKEAGFGLGRHAQVIDPAIVERACAEVATRMRLEPARDRKGAAVASVQNALVGIIEPK